MAVHNVGLTADLGREPSGQDSPEARGSHQHCGEEEEAGRKERAFPAQVETPETEAQHREADAKHDPERKEDRQDRRALIRRHVLQAWNDATEFMRQDVTSELRNGDLVMVGLGLLIWN